MNNFKLMVIGGIFIGIIVLIMSRSGEKKVFTSYEIDATSQRQFIVFTLGSDWGIHNINPKKYKVYLDDKDYYKKIRYIYKWEK